MVTGQSDIEQIVNWLKDQGFPVVGLTVIEGKLQIVIEIPLGDTLQ